MTCSGKSLKASEKSRVFVLFFFGLFLFVQQAHQITEATKSLETSFESLIGAEKGSQTNLGEFREIPEQS